MQGAAFLLLSVQTYKIVFVRCYEANDELYLSSLYFICHLSRCHDHVSRVVTNCNNSQELPFSPVACPALPLASNQENPRGCWVFFMFPFSVISNHPVIC